MNQIRCHAISDKIIETSSLEIRGEPNWIYMLEHQLEQTNNLYVEGLGIQSV